MARAFNGTTDKAISNTPTGIILSQLTVSMWLWVTAYKNPSYGVALTYDQANAVQHGGFIIAPSSNTAGKSQVMFFNATASAYWIDAFPQPSTGAWHHWLYVLSRSSPSNKVWIDGVAQTLTAVEHDSASYGGFLQGGQFYVGAESASANFQGMRITELGMFNAQWGQHEATALAAGASVLQMPQDGTAMHVPFGGYDSPEPRWNGPNPVAPPNHTQISMALTGTTFVKGPAARYALSGRFAG